MRELFLRRRLRLLGLELSGMRVASAKTIFADTEIVLKVREAVPYLTFMVHVTLVLTPDGGSPPPWEGVPSR